MAEAIFLLPGLSSVSSNLGLLWSPQSSPEESGRTHGGKENLMDAEGLGGDATLRSVAHYSGL